MNKSKYLIEYDVVIAGGGVSGAIAAIAAGRSGASVLVIEQVGYLGGALTSCGVGPMMTFFAGEKQVIKGITDEVISRMVDRGYSSGHVKDTTQYISYTTPFDSEGMKLILDEMLTEAGCELLFHTFVGEVNREGKRISSIKICNKDGLNNIYGKVFVDATGDGDIAAWAGVQMTKGRYEDGAMQPMTMKMKFCNVKTDQLKKFVFEHITEFPRLVNNVDILKSSNHLALAGFHKAFKKAIEKGELSIPREEVLFFETNNKGEFIINTTRIINHDATDAFSLSKAEVIGRQQCAELEKFLRNHVPGFEGALLEFTGPSIGIRSSRQLVGMYTLTAQDILEQKSFKSVIAHSGYPVDIHNPEGKGTISTFMSQIDTYYSIPFEIMVCEEIDNLLVTGRCVSATFEAQASIRVTPSAGALGHACGIAAAMAAKSNIPTRKIDIQKLQEKLKEQNAYLDI